MAHEHQDLITQGYERVKQISDYESRKIVALGNEAVQAATEAALAIDTSWVNPAHVLFDVMPQLNAFEDNALRGTLEDQPTVLFSDNWDRNVCARSLSVAARVTNMRLFGKYHNEVFMPFLTPDPDVSLATMTTGKPASELVMPAPVVDLYRSVKAIRKSHDDNVAAVQEANNQTITILGAVHFGESGSLTANDLSTMLPEISEHLACAEEARLPIEQLEHQDIRELKRVLQVAAIATRESLIGVHDGLLIEVNP